MPLIIYYYPDLEVPTSLVGKIDFGTAENNADLCLKVGNLLRNITDIGVRNPQLARCVYEYRTIVQKIPLICELLSSNRAMTVMESWMSTTI